MAAIDQSVCPFYKQMQSNALIKLAQLKTAIFSGLTTDTAKCHGFLSLSTLKIKLFGHQPSVKITDKVLDRLIQREFGDRADKVRQKLREIKSESTKGDNRICAAILKFANKNINALDRLIEAANNDPRDVLAPAEYPRYSKIAFSEAGTSEKKKLYLADRIEYAIWISNE